MTPAKKKDFSWIPPTLGITVIIAVLGFMGKSMSANATTNTKEHAEIKSEMIKRDEAISQCISDKLDRIITSQNETNVSVARLETKIENIK